MIGKHFTQEMELMEAIDVGLYTEGSLLVYSPLIVWSKFKDRLFILGMILMSTFLVSAL
jgi:hypothetical protein